MQKKIKLAQVGCGYWGPNLIRSFLKIPECTLSVIVETDEKRVQYITENFSGITVTREFDRVLLDSSIDGILIATPAKTHHSFAKQALNAGKHVFVEKPLAMEIADACELERMAQSKNLTLMVGHTFLYNRAVQYLKKMIDHGELGDLYYVYSQRLNLGQVRNDINVWWNLAPHDISILLYWMKGQSPTRISASGMSYIQNKIEDVVFANLQWDKQMTAAQVHLSWLDPIKTRRMTLVGSKKMIVYDDVSDAKITIYDKAVERVPLAGGSMDYDEISAFKFQYHTGAVTVPKLNVEEPLLVEARHFIQCIRTGEEPETGGKHAVQVVKVLKAGHDALLKSSAIRF